MLEVTQAGLLATFLVAFLVVAYFIGGILLTLGKMLEHINNNLTQIAEYQQKTYAQTNGVNEALRDLSDELKLEIGRRR